MTAVANWTAMRSQIDITNLPIIFAFTVMNTISPIIGGEPVDEIDGGEPNDGANDDADHGRYNDNSRELFCDLRPLCHLKVSAIA
jgi:hypothetical protein